MNPKLWVHFHQQMNVVGHNLQLYHFGPQFDGSLLDDFFQACVHSIDQHFAAVFGTPDYMVLAGGQATCLPNTQ